ncbi:MAG: dTDP-4-dehydrorhamnose reductase [Rhodobacteraceae bacterium]|nr:dTDP-4-dehydrorhamnose reductase [Paracoccaceae bacterium]
MRLLVFGRTGQVARELERRLPARWEAVFLDRASADLSDPEACARIVASAKAEAIINAAAWSDVDGAEAHEAEAHVVNAEAPTAMARAAATRGLPFLHVSSDYVFDGTGQNPWRETDPTGPLSAYGRTKVAGEEAIRVAGGAHVILRTSWIFSAHGKNFLKTMLRLSETRDSLSIVADQIGGPTPASAIAEALLTMAERLVGESTLSGTYHFAGAPDVTWADFARDIFRNAGRRVTVEGIASSAYPTSVQRPPNSRLDCSLICERFGIKRPDWQLAVKETIEDLGVEK